VNAKEIYQSMINLGISLNNVSKETMKFIAEFNPKYVEKLKRKKQYLRQYRNRGKKVNQ